MNTKKDVIIKEDGIARIIQRIAFEIMDRNIGEKELCLIGIRTRGAHLAFRLAREIGRIEKREIPVGILDITLYRDDIAMKKKLAIVKKTDINFDINNKAIVIVDDVLFTGRTVRAALGALIDFGRPKVIQLAVLIDRGGRELPIQADYIGRTVEVPADKKVVVHLKEEDGEDVVFLKDMPIN